MTAVSKGFRAGPLGNRVNRMGCPIFFSAYGSLKGDLWGPTVSVGTIKLSDSLLGILLLLVSHIGCALRSTGTIVAQLKSDN